MNKIKEYILDVFEDVQFLPGKDKLLVGYAERFGADCIPLYRGINYFPCDSSEETFQKINVANPKARQADGFDECLIGSIKLEDNTFVLLYDKDKIINQLKEEYSKDTSGLFKDEDDINESAYEHFSFNIIGAYMDGVPAFATLLEEL